MTQHSPDSLSPHGPAWTPDPERVKDSRIVAFTKQVEARHHVDLPDYDSLWNWSVDNLPEFWAELWAFFDMRSSSPYGQVLDSMRMPGANWFLGARLNYVSHVFRDRNPDDVAIIEVLEDGHSSAVTWRDLERRVADVADAFDALGVAPGDRVAGYVSNTSSAIVAFLATASLGAVWSCCGTDYAADAAAKRLAQLEPKILVAADGYYFGGKSFDRRTDAVGLADMLPTIEHVVHIAHLGLETPAYGPPVLEWDSLPASPRGLEPLQVPFDHPLWVLYSSGTTGIPKGIVHGHGGITLDAQKNLGLQMDMTSKDRLFWYTSPNWMMWNFVVNALLLGSSVVIYDGSPTYPSVGRLWEIADASDATILGASPGYLQACERAGYRVPPSPKLRMIGATGSPVPPSAFAWVRAQLGGDVPLVSMSGGTDICSALASGAANKAIWPGELPARALGMAVETWDETGQPVEGKVGELVVTKPMPSMPVKLWNDPDGSKYKSAYFDVYPGVWRHGDWATITDHGSVIIHGRSDATLNRFGVRLGSSDIYDVVERQPGIVESLVVGIELPDGGYWMPLFVVLEPGTVLDDELRRSIATAIRVATSPRHVPDEIIAVPAVPHTRTGKKLEVPIKRILQGMPPEDAVSRDAVDDVAALDSFAALRWRTPASTG
ncbi:acetoacetate--CoA ligase [Microbacterium timonense]|uniref:acetoacetate--CoA ligase n=1 Tax=Microbacterium timonense TaxID=2086576 RepID=UPI000D0F58D0|nr:acetoacetate--CoA ligase [Microbacterium timonense]